MVSAEQDPAHTDRGRPRHQWHAEHKVDGIQAHEERGDEARARHVAGRESEDVRADCHERVRLAAGRSSATEHCFQHSHKDYVSYQTCNLNKQIIQRTC